MTAGIDLTDWTTKRTRLAKWTESILAVLLLGQHELISFGTGLRNLKTLPFKVTIKRKGPPEV
jgi:hypothetical protein